MENIDHEGSLVFCRECVINGTIDTQRRAQEILQIGVPFLLSPVLDEHAEVRRRRGSSTVEGHIDDGHGVLAIERNLQDFG
jgi:hypothetical protein